MKHNLDDFKSWLDWGVKGLVAVLLTFAVDYLRSMSKDIYLMSTAIVEIKSENKNLYGIIQELRTRVDRLESAVLFKQK